MPSVKCRASPEGTTTERSVYPLQGVQTAGCASGGADCRLRGLKKSFEERRVRVFKSSLLIPSRREQYMWRVSDKYSEKPFSQLKQAELHGIFGKRSAAEYTKKGLEQMRVPQGTHISPICLRLNAGQVPKGPRLKGVYTPFRGCRLQAASICGKQSAASIRDEADLKIF